jgi:hypothetical protein
VRDDMTRGAHGAPQPDDDQHDAFVERVAATLGTLPPADPAATARILAAVEARRRERAAAAAGAAPDVPPPARADVVDIGAARGRHAGVHRFTVRALAGVGLAAALGGFMVRGLVAPGGLRVAERPAAESAPAVAAQAEPSSAPGLVPVADDAVTRRMQEEAVLHMVPFMLAAPNARRVVLVGDFNAWNAESTPLERDRNGVWTTFVPVSAGRHSYAFVVDDSVWTLDPRASQITDPDLGTRHSVLLVGAQ